LALAFCCAFATFFWLSLRSLDLGDLSPNPTSGVNRDRTTLALPSTPRKSLEESKQRAHGYVQCYGQGTGGGWPAGPFQTVLCSNTASRNFLRGWPVLKQGSLTSSFIRRSMRNPAPLSGPKYEPTDTTSQERDASTGCRMI